jgi:hypothetical protein
MAEPRAAAGAEGRAAERGVEPPKAVETRARGVVQAERLVAAEPQGAVVAEERAGEDSQAVAAVAGAPRSGGLAPASACHNIRRIYFPMEMTCDNSGTRLGE